MKHGRRDSKPEVQGEMTCSQALARANLVTAWKRVKANRGSAGVDGKSIAETADYLKTHWPRIREALVDGSYRPRRCGASRFRSVVAGCVNWGFRR